MAAILVFEVRPGPFNCRPMSKLAWPLRRVLMVSNCPRTWNVFSVGGFSRESPVACPPDFATGGYLLYSGKWRRSRVGQAIVCCGLSGWAFGPRNSMKNSGGLREFPDGRGAFSTLSGSRSAPELTDDENRSSVPQGYRKAVYLSEADSPH